MPQHVLLVFLCIKNHETAVLRRCLMFWYWDHLGPSGIRFRKGVQEGLQLKVVCLGPRTYGNDDVALEICLDPRSR